MYSFGLWLFFPESMCIEEGFGRSLASEAAVWAVSKQYQNLTSKVKNDEKIKNFEKLFFHPKMIAERFCNV